MIYNELAYAYGYTQYISLKTLLKYTKNVQKHICLMTARSVLFPVQPLQTFNLFKVSVKSFCVVLE